METTIVDLAANKKFSEFSDAIKQELKNKMLQREEIKSYNSEFDNIQRFKNLFAQINKTGE